MAEPEGALAPETEAERDAAALAAWEGFHAWASLTTYADDSDGLLGDIETLARALGGHCPAPDLFATAEQRAAHAAAVRVARAGAILRARVNRLAEG